MSRCEKNLWFSLYRKKVRLLVEFFRLFENFILKRLFNRVSELSKANEKQRRCPFLYVGLSAKRIFGLACIEKKFVS